MMQESYLIRSIDLIEETGISSVKLNHYIDLGIPTQSSVNCSGPEEKGVKHIGCFLADIFERIFKVNLLKQQDNSCEDIALVCQDTLDGASNTSLKDQITRSFEMVPLKN